MRSKLADQPRLWLSRACLVSKYCCNSTRRVPPGAGYYYVAPDTDGSAWVVDARRMEGWRYDPATQGFAKLPGQYYCAMNAPDGAVVKLCSCPGEPMDELRSDDPELLRYLARRPRSDPD